MKKLIQKKDNRLITSVENIKDFEKELKISFPDELSEFILNYEGCYLDPSESYYYGENKIFEVHSILYLRKHPDFASIEAIYEGHIYYDIKGFIPFAVDSGGWDYNVSINKETYGQIWINKFDSGDEDTMEYVAPSLEVFIDALTSEEEANKKL